MTIADKYIDSLVFCIPQLANAAIQKTCRWHTGDHISFGTALRELERLNGGAFTLLGFGFDYQGGVVSWNGGALEKSLERACGGLGLRVNPVDEHPSAAQNKIERQVTGDKRFSSHVRAMQELHPEVGWMSMSFEKCVRHEEQWGRGSLRSANRRAPLFRCYLPNLCEEPAGNVIAFFRCDNAHAGLL